MKILLSILILGILTSCVSYSPTVPKEYTGSTATIDDSFQRVSNSKANLFYVSKINDSPTHNNLAASQHASSGKGSQLVAMGASRSVAAQPLRLHLVGQVHHAAPIGYMLNGSSNYRIEGEIEFTPNPESKYRVNGYLSVNKSAVWLENINGEVISDIIGVLPRDKKVPRKNRNNLTKKEQFSDILGGESPDLIIEKFGEPSSTFTHKGNIFSQRPEKTIWYFERLGSIHFSSRNSKPLFVEKSIPLTQEINNLENIKESLDHAGPSLQRTAKNYHNQGGITEEVMDLFANKVWEHRSSQDRHTIDALSYFCKILGKSKNARYRTFLEKVEQTAASHKLKKYAKYSVALLPNEDRAQFLPHGN